MQLKEMINMTQAEQDFINELMKLTGSNRTNVEAMVEMLKAQMPSSFDSGNADDMKEDKDEIMDYPRYLPRKDVKKYTIRFALKYIRPIIWRKVEVPSNISLRHLAETIIDVMGWSGYHLNHFRVGNDFYEPGYQRDHDMENMGFAPIRHYNQEEYVVEDVLDTKGKSIEFEYDFGDSWEHEVRLSSISDYQEGEARLIRFIGGKRACPPEDCGGVWGYEELCRIHEKKASGKRLKREERERLEWYANADDNDYHPDYIDYQDCKESVSILNEEEML